MCDSEHMDVLIPEVLDDSTDERISPQLVAALRRQLNIALSDAGYWKAMHHEAVKREEALKAEVRRLNGQLRLSKEQSHGKKSERSKSYRQKQGKQRSKKKRSRGNQPGTKGHGRKKHENLPVEPEERELAEGEAVCPCCGLPYEEESDSEDSEVVEVEVRAHRRQIKRKRYRRTCQCPNLPERISAPPAPKLFPKGAYDVSLWAFLLIEKFHLKRPTARTLTMLEIMCGLELSQGTVTDGFHRLLSLFEPLYDGIIEMNLKSSHWHIDETGWMVLCGSGNNEGVRTNWCLWVFCSGSTTVYLLVPSRAAKVAADYLGYEVCGIIIADRYSVYKSKELLNGRYLLVAFCWAHVRRDFVKLSTSHPHLADWSQDWIDRIGHLFKLNQDRLEVLDKPSWPKANDRLHAGLEEMQKTWKAELADPKLPAGSRKVLESLERHWDGLTVFADYPRIPMDNTEAERKFRDPVVGRKNFHGSGSHWSAKLTAIMFTLFTTLCMWGINPYGWTTRYLNACAENNGQAPPNPESFLPWNLSEQDLDSLRRPLPSDTS